MNNDFDNLTLDIRHPVKLGRAGLFISIGEGTHIHRTIPSYELIFVRRGHLQMFEEERHFDIHAGQCLLLWPERRHGGDSPYTKDLSFYWLHFTLDEYCPQTEFSSVKGEWTFSVPQLAVPARIDYFSELYCHLLDDLERGQVSTVQGAIQTMQILHEASLCNSQTESSEAALSMAGHIQTFIDEHNNQAISTSDIAKAMGYNEDYLGRVFRQARQMTITEAIHRSQIRLAKTLLQSSYMNVNQVAQHCGYHDTRYFIRLFKRYEGLTPSAFRKLYARAYINRY